MPDRNTSIVALMIFFAVTTGVSALALIICLTEYDSREKLIYIEEHVRLKRARLKKTDAQMMLEGGSLSDGKTVEGVEKELGELKAEIDKVKEDFEGARQWRTTEYRKWEANIGQIAPEVQAYYRTFRSKFEDMRNLDKAIAQAKNVSRQRRMQLRRLVLEERTRLMREKRQNEEHRKIKRDHIADVRIRVARTSEKLERVRVHRARGSIFSPDGKVIGVGPEVTNFVAFDLGYVHGVRKAMKFDVFEQLPGYPWEEFEDQNRNYVADVIPGQRIVFFPGTDAEESYWIVRVAPRDENNQPQVHKLLVIGHPPSSAHPYEIRSDREIRPTDQGVLVKGKLEVQRIHPYWSEGVLLPSKWSMPQCPSCGWESAESDMDYCPYCFTGDNNDEIQPLIEATGELIVPGRDRLHPIKAWRTGTMGRVEGDFVANPYFSAEQKLTFVFAGDTIRRSLREIKYFIEENDGVLQDELTLDTNFLVAGTGPEADRMVKKARELGVKILREDELYGFFGKRD